MRVTLILSLWPQWEVRRKQSQPWRRSSRTFHSVIFFLLFHSSEASELRRSQDISFELTKKKQKGFISNEHKSDLWQCDVNQSCLKNVHVISHSSWQINSFIRFNCPVRHNGSASQHYRTRPAQWLMTMMENFLYISRIYIDDIWWSREQMRIFRHCVNERIQFSSFLLTFSTFSTLRREERVKPRPDLWY